MSALPRLGRNERRLLLACARVRLDAEREAEVRWLLDQPLDWDAVVFFARLHSVASLLHRHIKDLAEAGRVPATARRQLLALYQRAAYRNREFARENALVVDAFSAAGISVIVQKGLSVVDLVYGSLALRPLIDLIFLVRPHQLSAAGEVIVRQGYSARPIRLRKSVYDWCCPQAWFTKHDGFKLPILIKGQLINWSPRYRFTPERVWADARPAVVAGSQVLVLSPVDLVLYLCVNADNHGFFNHAAMDRVQPTDLLFETWSHNRLVRFTDIHESVRRRGEELDWDALVRRARSCRIEAATRTSLSLTGRLLGQGAPQEVLRSLSQVRGLRLRRALMAVAAEDERERSTAKGLGATIWRKLGFNAQREVIWVVAFAELVFASRRVPGAEQASRTGSLGVTGKTAVRSLLRSARSFLLALTWSPSGPRRAAAAERRLRGGP